MRVHAALAAVSVAEEFRQQGQQVLLLLDSLTRLAMAQRELGLALGEPPSSRGYTPSVFQLLAATLERLGPAERGSITALLTVLVEGDEMEEPIADACRAILDGHIVLDRQLAEKGHYPAIDISRSISRVAREVMEPSHAQAAQQVRAMIATLAEVEDLVRIGAYVRGSNPQVDRALELQPALWQFLRQNPRRTLQFHRNSNRFTKTRGCLECKSWPNRNGHRLMRLNRCAGRFAKGGAPLPRAGGAALDVSLEPICAGRFASASWNSGTGCHPVLSLTCRPTDLPCR
jgi:FliI/YscN family ATPase